MTTDVYYRNDDRAYGAAYRGAASAAAAPGQAALQEHLLEPPLHVVQATQGDEVEDQERRYVDPHDRAYQPHRDSYSWVYCSNFFQTDEFLNSQHFTDTRGLEFYC